jgi:hypothetical protein
MFKYLAIACALTCVSVPAAHAQYWQLTTAQVSITKTQTADGLRLDLIHKSGDQVTVEIDPSNGTGFVTRNNVRRSLTTLESVHSIQVALATSPAVRAFRQLAGRRANDESREGEMIRLEDALVAFLSGDHDAARRHADHVRLKHQRTSEPVAARGAKPGAARLRLVQGSGDPCWDGYTVRAVAAANDFVRCKAETRWWDLVAGWTCDAEYVIRAEAAWAFLWGCEAAGGGRGRA